MKTFSTATFWWCVQLACAAAAVPPDGFWNFEDAPGFLADSSAHGRTLSNTGVVPVSSGGPAAGQAAVFTGTQRLTVPDAPLWSSPRFTIEAYFRLSAVSTGSTQVIASHHNNTGNQRDWHLAEAGGKLRFHRSTNGTSAVTVDSFTLTAGHDYFAAAIVDSPGSSVRLVLKDLTTGADPQTEQKTISTATYDADAMFSIGATGTTPTGTSFFKGVIDGVRFTSAALGTAELQEPFASDPPVPPNPVDRTKVDGFKGIWFTLGQYSAYGDKYSGGLGTYTTNHRPIAVHAPRVGKTFFTYGGTTGPDDRHLLIMAGEYDHATHTVKKPTLVMDKSPVDDPHDNGCITIDKDGYLWIFVSGRGTVRPGFTYRSAEPYSVDGFVRISPAAGEQYTYPQIWYDPVKGFLHLLTRYNGSQRELFFRTSADGFLWSGVQPLAKIQGHYQVSGRNGNMISTFFNRHPGGNVDARTDLYYMQTTDHGQTWTTADGTPLAVPLTTAANPARVMNYSAQGRLMYGIDIAFDGAGRPVLFYLTSANHQPGPAGEPRTFHTARWTGTEWVIRDLPPSATPVSTAAHNYATGTLWIENGVWNIIAPTGADQALRTSDPKRYWGQGGELQRWHSDDQGLTWTKDREVTENSPRNHGYVRHPQDGTGRFFTLWADGNPSSITESHLYFGNADGTRMWELPYDMAMDTATPVEVNPPFLRWRRGHFTAVEMADGSTVGPAADPDGDGRSNMVEYTQGSNPRVRDFTGNLAVEVLGDPAGEYLRLDYSRNANAFDLRGKLESSTDLEIWQDTGGSLFDISAQRAGDVIHLTRGHRVGNSLPGERRFYRLNYEFDE